MLQIGINPSNPLALGAIICVETFAMFAMPAYLLAEWSGMRFTPERQADDSMNPAIAAGGNDNKNRPAEP